MANGNRLTFAIVGGVFCAIVGSLLGALILLLFALRGVGIDAVAFYPIAFLYVAFLAVPFGFVAGSVGSCLLAFARPMGFLQGAPLFRIRWNWRNTRRHLSTYFLGFWMGSVQQPSVHTSDFHHNRNRLRNLNYPLNTKIPTFPILEFLRSCSDRR